MTPKLLLCHLNGIRIIGNDSQWHVVKSTCEMLSVCITCVWDNYYLCLNSDLMSLAPNKPKSWSTVWLESNTFQVCFAYTWLAVLFFASTRRFLLQCDLPWTSLSCDLVDMLQRMLIWQRIRAVVDERSLWYVRHGSDRCKEREREMAHHLVKSVWTEDSEP